MRGRLVSALAVMAVLAGPGVAVAAAHQKPPHAVDVRYGPWTDETATLYGATDQPRPTVVYVHASGWIYGQIGANSQAFASRLSDSLGWPVLAISYPTTDQGSTPARDVEQQAVNDAVHYVAGLPSTDPAHIVLWGESAGGNLALLDAERDATHPHPRVSAVVSISGPTDVRAEWPLIPDDVTEYEGETPTEADLTGSVRYAATSPALNPVVGQPPIFQAVGTDDTLMSTPQVEAMDLAARSVGGQSVMYELAGNSHHAQWLEPDVIPTTGNTVERQAELFLFTHAAARS